jgi:hypothetical protein
MHKDLQGIGIWLCRLQLLQGGIFLIDKKEFEILKKLVVELTKNQVNLQKELIKLREYDLKLTEELKEVADVAKVIIGNIRMMTQGTTDVEAG